MSEQYDDVNGVSIVTVEPGKALDLYIENPNGDTVIRATTRDDVQIRWEKEGRAGTPFFDEAQVQVSHDEDNRVTVKIAMPALWNGGDFGRSVLKFLEGGLKGSNPFGGLMGGRVSFDLQIELPLSILADRTGRIRVRTANGDVRLAAVEGIIDIATANGDVSTTEARGDVSLHAANGNLTLDRPVGRVTARTVSGDLKLTGGELSRFTLNTVSGDTTVETSLSGDSSRLESVSGEIRLDLTFPEATGGTLTARSVSGNATVEPPFRSVAKRTWRIGPGTDDGPTVAIKSVSGNLRARGTLSTQVTKSPETIILSSPVGAEPPTSPAPPSPPTPSAPASPFAPPMPPRAASGVDPDAPTAPVTVIDRMAGRAASPASAPSDAQPDARLAILQAVERGEIDIDEAMRRLDARG